MGYFLSLDFNLPESLDARSDPNGVANGVFFRCMANDDVACWEKEKPGKVIIVHDFASPGWEDSGEFNTFWDWFRSLIDEFIENG